MKLPNNTYLQQRIEHTTFKYTWQFNLVPKALSPTRPPGRENGEEGRVKENPGKERWRTYVHYSVICR